MKKQILISLISLFLLGGCSSNETNVSSSSISDDSSSSLTSSTNSSTSEANVYLTDITLSGDYPTTFYVDETFSSTGLVVKAIYSDSSSKEVTNYSLSTPDMSKSGHQDVTITYIEDNIAISKTYDINIIRSVFNEPYINRQYYLNHIGDIYSVWKHYQGRGVTIAVIDSAFDPYHEDLYFDDGTSKVSSLSASFSYDGYNVNTKVGIDYTYDLSDSHGAFCAGVAAAALNGKGVIGVAPEANLMLLKTDKKPKSIVEAFKYACTKGAKVVTISIGSYYNYDGDLVNDGSDLATVFNEATTYCYNNGVVVCSAGGNGGLSQPNEYTWPGASEHVIGCGGLANNESGEIWEESSYNSSKQYQFIDVFAPGENMFNICNYMNGSTRVIYDGGWNGTSFSSPIVAGLAALYFEKYPNNNAMQFETALYNSCHKITTSEIASFDQLGYGRVDALRLLGLSNDVEVNIKVKTSWPNTYVYAYNLETNKEIASWPGVMMAKSGDTFSYTINVSKYDLLLFSNGDSLKSVNLLSSSFIDGHTYVLSSYKENNLYVGSYSK